MQVNSNEPFLAYTIEQNCFSIILSVEKMTYKGTHKFEGEI